MSPTLRHQKKFKPDFKKKEAITRIVGALNVEGHIAETIFDLGLHNKKITKEAHQKKYGG